ncbi:hypothetical protein Btru_074834 [Bulinus truncatus]|nr:hypothetical protein Btru_074834 [Bulinus truncatus]
MIGYHVTYVFATTRAVHRYHRTEQRMIRLNNGNLFGGDSNWARIEQRIVWVSDAWLFVGLCREFLCPTKSYHPDKLFSGSRYSEKLIIGLQVNGREIGQCLCFLNIVGLGRKQQETEKPNYLTRIPICQ